MKFYLLIIYLTFTSLSFAEIGFDKFVLNFRSKEKADLFKVQAKHAFELPSKYTKIKQSSVEWVPMDDDAYDDDNDAEYEYVQDQIFKKIEIIKISHCLEFNISPCKKYRVFRIIFEISNRFKNFEFYSIDLYNKNNLLQIIDKDEFQSWCKENIAEKQELKKS